MPPLSTAATGPPTMCAAEDVGVAAMQAMRRHMKLAQPQGTRHTLCGAAGKAQAVRWLNKHVSVTGASTPPPPKEAHPPSMYCTVHKSQAQHSAGKLNCWTVSHSGAACRPPGHRTADQTVQAKELKVAHDVPGKALLCSTCAKDCCALILAVQLDGDGGRHRRRLTTPATAALLQHLLTERLVPSPERHPVGLNHTSHSGPVRSTGGGWSALVSQPALAHHVTAYPCILIDLIMQLTPLAAWGQVVQPVCSCPALPLCCAR